MTAEEFKSYYKPSVVAALNVVFDRVRDPKDWKAPIHTFIHPAEFARVNEAVEFFTATRCRVVGEVFGYPHEDALVKVIVALEIEADGYRAGPAGDH